MNSPAMSGVLSNGVTREELTELVTHLAFYAGWPVANSAIPILRKAFEEARPDRTLP